LFFGELHSDEWIFHPHIKARPMPVSNRIGVLPIAAAECLFLRATRNLLMRMEIGRKEWRRVFVECGHCKKMVTTSPDPQRPLWVLIVCHHLICQIQVNHVKPYLL
jgi:hypothetical protein